MKNRSRRELSAGGVVVRKKDGQAHVLIIRDPYENWGLPKGHLERMETEAEAALREVEEETGLRDLVLGEELPVIDWYFRKGDVLVHKFCRFYLMESQQGDPEPDTSEGISECRWVPFEEALEKVAYDNARSVIRAAQETLEGRTGGADD